ncbi:MAG TPA: GcrA family cell cycle regulator [Acidocella sp.]|nr:GcrA family cell cycle regulator [Acidocella sp.]
MDWTPEAIAKLTQLWADGLPTAEIARRLGCSKNAAVGKAHRLHLPGRPSPINANPVAKPKPQRLRGNITPAQVHLLPKPQPTAVRLYMGRQEACQWMIDPEPCNQTVVGGKPYCAAHCERAYRKRMCEAA